MTSYFYIFTFVRFCILQGFRKYKNEVSSPSSSIVIESERFYIASADSNPILPVQIWCKIVTKLFLGVSISRRLKHFKNEVNISILTREIR